MGSEIRGSGRENGIMNGSARGENRYIENTMPKSFKDAPNYLKSNSSRRGDT